MCLLFTNLKYYRESENNIHLTQVVGESHAELTYYNLFLFFVFFLLGAFSSSRWENSSFSVPHLVNEINLNFLLHFCVFNRILNLYCLCCVTCGTIFLACVRVCKGRDGTVMSAYGNLLLVWPELAKLTLQSGFDNRTNILKSYL